MDELPEGRRTTCLSCFLFAPSFLEHMAQWMILPNGVSVSTAQYRSASLKFDQDSWKRTNPNSQASQGSTGEPASPEARDDVLRYLERGFGRVVI